MSASQTTLWDLAGVDGLAIAQTLFPEAARLSVWQSLDTDWGGSPCSLLRLCEGNFRVGVYGGQADALTAELVGAAHGRRAWVKPSRLAGLIALDALEALAPLATVKPPHRIAGLPPGGAVPARLDNRAVVLWRHTVAGKLALEIQTAPGDLAAVHEILCHAGVI